MATSLDRAETSFDASEQSLVSTDARGDGSLPVRVTSRVENDRTDDVRPYRGRVLRPASNQAQRRPKIKSPGRDANDTARSSNQMRTCSRRPTRMIPIVRRCSAVAFGAV